MKKTAFILLLFLIGCGYQPVYLNKNIENFEFSKIIYDGNSGINRKITNTLPIKESVKSSNKLNIFSSYEVKIVSKDVTGSPASFRSAVVVKLAIEDSNTKNRKEKNFFKEFSYNKKENKFDLVEYQDSIKNDLVNEIIREIIIYLNSE